MSRALEHVPFALICGLPGMGKSALALRWSEEWSGPVLISRVRSEDSLVPFVELAARQIQSLTGQPAHDLEGLLRALDVARGLWIIDDVHLLAESDRTSLALSLAAHLHNGRALLTSRLRLPDMSPPIDYLQLHLRGLDRESAEAIWSHLDTLQGESSGFQEAFKRTGANPLMLRRSHVRLAYLDDDPIDAAIADLTSGERDLLLIIALLRFRPHVEDLEAVLSVARLRAVVGGLRKALILDVNADGALVLHDLFLNALLDRETPESLRPRHEHIVDAYQHGALGSALDPVQRLCETSHHLCLLERYEESSRLLEDNSTTFIRLGAPRTLLHLCNSLWAHWKSESLLLVRARTLGHLLDNRRAYAALAPYVYRESPSTDVLLAFAQSALLAGELDAAADALDKLHARQLSRAERLRRDTAWALLCCYQGRPESLYTTLRPENEADKEAAGYVSFLHAFSYWFEERYEDALESMQSAMMHFSDSSPSVRQGVLARIVLVSLYLHTGALERATGLLAEVEQSLHASEDLRMRSHLGGARAENLLVRGQRSAACRAFYEHAEVHRRAGEPITALWAEIMAVRCKLVIGFRHDALRELDRLADRGRALGALGITRIAERSRDFDPVAALQRYEPEQTDLRPSQRSRYVRHHALGCLWAAAHGDMESLREGRDRVAALAFGDDYALDRALLSLSQDPAPSLPARDLFDPDILELAGAYIRGSRLVAPVEPGACSPTLNMKRHQLTDRDGRTVLLARKRVLRELLYALAVPRARRSAGSSSFVGRGPRPESLHGSTRSSG